MFASVIAALFAASAIGAPAPISSVTTAPSASVDFRVIAFHPLPRPSIRQGHGRHHHSRRFHLHLTWTYTVATSCELSSPWDTTSCP